MSEDGSQPKMTLLLAEDKSEMRAGPRPSNTFLPRQICLKIVPVPSHLQMLKWSEPDVTGLAASSPATPPSCPPPPEKSGHKHVM